MVQEFSKSWKTKLDILNQIKTLSDNKNIISYIKAYVKSEINAYNQFVLKEENYIYDVIINCISNHDEERYLCNSFDSIKDVINSYEKNYQEFLNKDDLKHIAIIKRKISMWDTP